jgi:large subunit ribosomal protein L16
MALMPKRVKYRKSQRGRVRGVATRGNYVAFGDYGVMAMEAGWISGQQLEAARVVLSRSLGPQGRYWCRVFPHKAVTALAVETRMGGGKGAVEYWAAVAKPGTILFEVAGVPEAVAREVFRLQAGKLPLRVKFIARRAAV